MEVVEDLGSAALALLAEFRPGLGMIQQVFRARGVWRVWGTDRLASICEIDYMQVQAEERRARRRLSQDWATWPPMERVRPFLATRQGRELLCKIATIAGS